MDSALDIQVGGNHYKDLQMQPIVKQKWQARY